MEKRYIFKDASAADAEAIAAIEAICFPEAWSRDMVAEAMANGTFYKAVFDDERLVGYAAAKIVIDEGQVANIAIHPDYRGKGLGKWITHNMIAQCFDSGCELITLEVRHTNEIAISLYTSLGFKEVGRRKGYYSDADAVLMNLSKGEETLG